jgi:hypothetical protein
MLAVVGCLSIQLEVPDRICGFAKIRFSASQNLQIANVLLPRRIAEL